MSARAVHSLMLAATIYACVMVPFTMAATTMYAVGDVSCGAWNHPAGFSALELRDWILGYMSGLAHDPAYPKDVLRRAKPESAITWISDYCKAHPRNGLAYAGVALVNELAKRVHGSK